MNFHYTVHANAAYILSHLSLNKIPAALLCTYSALRFSHVWWNFPGMAIVCTVLAPSFTLQTPCMLSELLRGRFGGVALVQLPFSLQATCCEFTANAASFILLILRNVCAWPVEHADLVTVSSISPVLVKSLTDVQVLSASLSGFLPLICIYSKWNKSLNDTDWAMSSDSRIYDISAWF